MKISVDEKGNIVLAEVFNSVVISTEQGDFGVCQRDGGLEVIQDGRVVFSTTNPPLIYGCNGR